MILRTVLIFTVLLVSLWMGIQLQHNPGYVLIALDQWTIETTLWVATVSLLLTFLILHMGLMMLQWMLKIPTSFRHWLEKRRIQNAQATTRQGLIEFSEGHWLKAKNHLINALPFTDTPLLNYLTAARAAQEMGDNTLRDDCLREAQQSIPEAKIAVELTQAQLQLANQQWEQALATLRHLQDLTPRHPYVLKLLMQLYKEMKDWPQLIALLPELKRDHVLTHDEFNDLQQQAYLETLLERIKQNQTPVIVQFIKKLPKELSDNPPIITAYCRYLLDNQNDVIAETILRRCLQKNPLESFIDLYGRLQSNAAHLSFAESLLKTTPHSASLYLCLGRIAVSHHLWGKAKIYFEKSLQLNPTPAAYAELGDLLLQLKDEKNACVAYQKGLMCAFKS